MHPIEHLRYLARAGHVDAPDLVAETAMALRGLGMDPSSLLVTCRRIVERHPTVGPLWWLCSEMVAAADPRDTARRCVNEVRDDSTPVHLAEHLAARFPDGALMCVNGWSWDIAVAFGQMEPQEVCVIDGDNGADHMVRVLERTDHVVHLVEAHAGASAVAAADVVVLSALAASPTNVWSVAGAHGMAAVAYCEQRTVVLSTPRGTRLSQPTIDGMARDLAEQTRGEQWHRGIDDIPLGLCHWVVGPKGAARVDSLGVAGLVAETAHAPELLVRSAM